MILRQNSPRSKSTPSQQTTKPKGKPAAKAKPKPEPQPEVKPERLPVRGCRRWLTPECDGAFIHDHSGRHDLTGTTQSRDDVKPGELCSFGRLVKCYARRDVGPARPLLVIAIPGKTKERFYPWRFGWPVSIETASRQPAISGKFACRRRWLLLDPGRLAESQTVWNEAVGEVIGWSKARQRAKKAAKKAQEVQS